MVNTSERKQADQIANTVSELKAVLDSERLKSERLSSAVVELRTDFETEKSAFEVQVADLRAAYDLERIHSNELECMLVQSVSNLNREKQLVRELQDKLGNAEKTVELEKTQCNDLDATVKSLLTANANECAKKEELNGKLSDLRVSFGVEKFHSKITQRLVCWQYSLKSNQAVKIKCIVECLLCYQMLNAACSVAA